MDTALIKHYFNRWCRATNNRIMMMAITYNNIFVLSEAINRLKQSIHRKNNHYFSYLACLLVNGRRLFKTWYKIIFQNSSYRSQMVLLHQGDVYANANSIHRALKKWMKYRKDINIMNESIGVSQIVVKILISKQLKKWLFNRFKKYHRIVVVNSLHRDFVEMAKLHYMMLRYVSVFQHFKYFLKDKSIKRRCLKILNSRIRSTKYNSLDIPIIVSTIRYWKFKVTWYKKCRNSYYYLQNKTWERTIMKYLGIWCVSYMRHKRLNGNAMKVIYNTNMNIKKRIIYGMQEVYLIILSEKNYQKQLLIQAEESYLLRLNHVRMKNEIAITKNFLLKWKILVQTRCITRYFIHVMTNTVGLQMLRRSFNRWKVLYDIETIVICVQKHWRSYKVKRLTHALLHQYMIQFKKNIEVATKFRKKYRKKNSFNLLQRHRLNKHMLYQMQHSKIQIKLSFLALGRWRIDRQDRRANDLLGLALISRRSKRGCFHSWIEFVYCRRDNYKLLKRYHNKHRRQIYRLFLTFLQYYVHRNNRHRLILMRMKYFLQSRTIWRFYTYNRKEKKLFSSASSASAYYRFRMLKNFKRWYRWFQFRKYNRKYSRVLIETKYLTSALRVLRKHRVIKQRNRSKLKYQMTKALQSRKFLAFLKFIRMTKMPISCAKSLQHMIITRGPHVLSKDVHGNKVSPVPRTQLSRTFRILINRTNYTRQERNLIKYISSNRCRHPFQQLLRYSIHRCNRKMERRKILKVINRCILKRAWVQCMNYFYFKRLKFRLICIHRLKCRIVKFMKYQKLMKTNRVKLLAKTKSALVRIKCRKMLGFMRKWNAKSNYHKIQRQICKVLAKSNGWYDKRRALLFWRRNIRSKTHRILNLQRKYYLKVTLMAWLKSALLSVKRKRSLRQFQYERIKNYLRMIFRGWKSYSLRCKRLGLHGLQVSSNNKKRIKYIYFNNWLITLHNAKVNQQIATICRRSIFHTKKMVMNHWRSRWFAVTQSKMYDAFNSMNKHFHLWIEYNSQNRLFSRLFSRQTARFQNWKVKLNIRRWYHNARMRVECKEWESHSIMHHNSVICRKLLTVWRNIFFRIKRYRKVSIKAIRAHYNQLKCIRLDHNCTKKIYQKQNYATVCMIKCNRLMQHWLMQTKRNATKKYHKFLNKYFSAWRSIVKHLVDTRGMYTFRLSFQFQRSIVVKAWKCLKYGIALYKRESIATIIGQRIRKNTVFLQWKKVIYDRYVVARVVHKYASRKLKLIFRYWKVYITSSLKYNERLLTLSVSAWKKNIKAIKYHKRKRLRVTYDAWIRFMELKSLKMEYSKRLILIRAALEQIFFRHQSQKIRILEKYFLKLKSDTTKLSFSYRRESHVQMRHIDSSSSVNNGTFNHSKSNAMSVGPRISKVEQHINTMNNLRMQASQIRSVSKVILVGESIRNDREKFESRIKFQNNTPLAASKMKDHFNIELYNSNTYENIIANDVSSVMDINELQ